MIAVLVVYGVVSVLTSLVVGAILARQNDRYQTLVEWTMRNEQEERDLLVRALLSRTPGEFANLDRVRGEVAKKVADAERAQLERTVSLSEPEYLEWLREDMERAGYDPSALLAPSSPEGI